MTPSQQMDPTQDLTDAGTAAQFYHRLAPWYLAYLSLGLIHSGMLPFLFPLALVSAGQGLGSVAYVIAAYYAGLLPAPLLGILAERRHRFRAVFFGGFLALAAGLAAMPKAADFGMWIPLACLAGLGVGAAATVAPLFVVDFAPRAEWEPRIGWLQGFYGAGQLGGLLLAGLIASGPLAYGFWLAAAFALTAIGVGRIGLPADGRSGDVRLPPLEWSTLIGGAHTSPGAAGLLQHSHHLHSFAWRQVTASLGSRFARFLLAWGLINFAVAPFFAYYPLLMRRSYGIAPTTTAWVYAAAAGIGIGLSVLAGWLAKRHGPRSVFRGGLALRIGGFVMLASLLAAPTSGRPAFAVVSFVLVVLAWPVISVAGTGLAAGLTPVGEGAAMGLMSTSNALATIGGTVLAGPLVAGLGYAVVPLIAILGLGAAEMLMAKGEDRQEPGGDQSARHCSLVAGTDSKPPDATSVRRAVSRIGGRGDTLSFERRIVPAAIFSAVGNEKPGLGYSQICGRK